MHIRRQSWLRALLLIAAAPVVMGGLGPRTNFDARILAAHNRERSQLGIAMLGWDAELAAGAAQWARHLSVSGRFEHSPDEVGEDTQGENIWGGTAGHYQPEAMVGLWVEEQQHYKPGTFPYNSRSGRVEDVSHYTQLIWAKTRRVGCAINAEGAEEILVCRYSSAGNIPGQRPV
jgi:hypothetical protein